MKASLSNFKKMINRSLLPAYNTDASMHQRMEAEVRLNKKASKGSRFFAILNYTDWGLGLRFRRASEITGFRFCVSLQILFIDLNMYLWNIINAKWVNKYAKPKPVRSVPGPSE